MKNRPDRVAYAVFAALIVIMVLVVLMSSGACPEGMFYSYRELACMPGMRP